MTSRNALYQKKHLHWVCPSCTQHWRQPKKLCTDCDCKPYKFDSDAEYRRYKELKWLETSCRIRQFRPKLVFPLVLYDVKGEEIEVYNKQGAIKRAIPTYESDFTYYDQQAQFVVEDVKSKSPQADDPVFKLKARLFRQIYGFDITIVRLS